MAVWPTRWLQRLQGLKVLQALQGLRAHRDTAVLAAAALLLAASFLQPGLNIQRQLFVHLVVLDVTQSMNVQDMVLEGKAASRGAYAKEALRQALLQLPCGSRVGLGLFTEYRSYLLLAPVEVCANLQELRSTLAQMDNTMAWTGNSEVTKGLFSGIAIAKQLGDKQLADKQAVDNQAGAANPVDKPSLVFITDGHEAPPLDPARKPPFNDKAAEVQGLVVGVGGLAPQAIPKTDPLGRSLGFWAADEVLHADPRTVRQAEAAPGAKAKSGSEHLSSQREAHLRQLAAETGLGFLNLQSPQALAGALTAPTLARPVTARADLRGLLAAAALALLLARHADAIKAQFQRLVSARGRAANTAKAANR